MIKTHPLASLALRVVGFRTEAVSHVKPLSSWNVAGRN